MKTNTFSIVVGTIACNANCPFCVAQMTKDTSNLPSMDVNWDKFDLAMDVVKAASNGLITVLLTGKGEPTLYPKQITQYLHKLSYEFPLVELQTNGTRLTSENLKAWSDQGLTGVCVSVCHYDCQLSNRLMGIEEEFSWRETVRLIKDSGLLSRVNLTVSKDPNGIDSPDAFEAFVEEVSQMGCVDQITVREIEVPEVKSAEKEVYQWSVENKANILGRVKRSMDRVYPVILTLPHGAVIYDVEGQNVCLNNCLTEMGNPDELRQLIFFPDGRLMHSWQYESARVV